MNKNLWAPWRMAYIRSKKNECFLCEALGNKNDKEALILFRGEFSAIIMNKFPYSCGHLMVIPNRHTDDMLSLNTNELNEINLLTNKCIRALKKAFSPSGFNIGYNIGESAGAGLAAHLHRHILPRHRNDANFITTLGGTRVIPQMLEDQYDKLFPLINNDNE